MDKSKIKPYTSQEELFSNAENVLKDWQKEEYKNYVFSARHIADDPEHPEHCLQLYLDENYRICTTNWKDWVHYMSQHEKLKPSELKIYETRLCNEFGLWVQMEADRLAELERKRIKESEKEAKLMGIFMTEALSRKNKYKN